MYSKWVTVSYKKANFISSKCFSDKNTSQRLALQYDCLQSADKEIKRNYTIPVSKILNAKNLT